MSRPKGSKNKIKLSISMSGESYIPIVEPPTQQVVNMDVNRPKIIEEGLKPKRSIQGWINIYKHVEDHITNFYTGSDIHYTLEDAKKISQKNVIGQVYITLEY